MGRTRQVFIGSITLGCVYLARPVAGLTVLTVEAARLISRVHLYHTPLDQVVAFAADLHRRAFLRGTKLSNRVFASYDAIVDACCNASNWLIQQPNRITTLGTRAWAHVTA